nr:hypothetical protein BaRGS_017058 [Batillaria attramentaria]
MADSSNALAILGVTEVEFLLDELSVTASTVQQLRADFCPEQCCAYWLTSPGRQPETGDPGQRSRDDWYGGTERLCRIRFK